MIKLQRKYMRYARCPFKRQNGKLNLAIKKDTTRKKNKKY